MSADLYRTRIFFDAHLHESRRGIAKCEEVEVQLQGTPVIPGLPAHFTLIDFAPQVRCFDIRESAAQRREMTPVEIEAATAWLQRLVTAVRVVMRPTNETSSA